jgi:glycosyltransferase involved in cell wall biosynthesis
MNVLVINLDKSIFSDNSSSLERLKEYSALADKIFVITWTNGREDKICPDERLEVIPTNSPFKCLYFYHTWKLAKKILKENKIDLIFTQDPFETGLAGWLIAKIYKLPLQLQIHTDFLSPYFWRESFLNKLRVVLAKFLIRRASYLRVVSERIRESVIKKFGLAGERIINLPIYVDGESIARAPLKADLRKKYPAFDFIILMASRLTKEKNISLAIRSMAKIAEKYPKTGMIIVGSGEEEMKLKKLAEPLKDNIIFKPWADEISSYLKTADMFLITSSYEGWSMAAVEAMAAGCPVVMTDVGCAGELVKDGLNGLVAPIGDEEEMVKNIFRLIENKDLREALTREAKRTANELPGKKEYLSRYLESWNNTIKFTR